MISVEKFREIIKSPESESDAQVKEIRDFIYKMSYNLLDDKFVIKLLETQKKRYKKNENT